MRSAKEISLKIGLIAGQGPIPERLVSRWEEQGHTPVIVGLKDITDSALFKNRIAAEFKIGQAGHILNFFKQNDVKKIVMIGALRRPNFWTIIPDWEGITILAKLLMRRRGDDSLLRFVRAEIERYGLTVVGVQEFMPELLCPAGPLTQLHPTTDQLKMITVGFDAAKQHGANDKGQSVVVTPNAIAARETEKGTNALIDSCANMQNAILVKASKPQQDLALDMPTIGISTVDHIIKAGLKGIAVESGKTIIMDKDDVVRKCDDHGIFLIGL